MHQSPQKKRSAFQKLPELLPKPLSTEILPRPPNASVTKQLLQNRLDRQKLRDSILRYSPHEVFRECINVFARSPSKYGPLWKLMQAEQDRVVTEGVGSREMGGCLWSSLTDAYHDYKREVDDKKQRQYLEQKLSTLTDEFAEMRDKEADIIEERDGLLAITISLRQTVTDMKYDMNGVEAEVSKLRSELVRTQSKNMQLQTVNEAYAEADDKKVGQKHMKLLKEIEELQKELKANAEKLEAFKLERDKCMEEWTGLNADCADLKLALEEKERIIRRGNAEIKAMSDERDALSSKLSSRDKSQSTKNAKEECDDSEYTVQWFIGKGNGLHVPRYLRWHGKLRNRLIKKGDLERVINDVWKSKMAHEVSNGSISLSDFFSIYINDKFPHDAQRRAEQAYSLVYSAERFKSDADCELFLAILRGEVPEQVWLDQLDLLAAVRSAFEDRDYKLNGKQTGILSQDAIKESLSQTVPMLSSWRYQALCEALKEDELSDEVQYAKLFVSDRNGNQGAFVEELRDQHLHSIQAYIADICEAVHDKATDEHVTWPTIKEAWLRLDPAVEQGLDSILFSISRAAKYPPPNSDAAHELLIAFSDFQSTFEKVFVRRMGTDPTGGDTKWNPATFYDSSDSSSSTESVIVVDSPEPEEPPKKSLQVMKTLSQSKKKDMSKSSLRFRKTSKLIKK